MNSIKNIIPGLLLSSILALLSIYFSQFLSLGAIAIAIFLGFIINSLFSNKLELFQDGISFSEKTLLSVAIILLGSYIDIAIFNYLSFYNILFIIFLIIISILVCYYLGRFLGISKNLSLLLGIGNAICGSSAIAGSSKILNANEDEIGISISIINALGAISIFSFPFFLLNIFPHFSNEQNGFIIGSTIQAFGQVTATGFIINNEVGEFATIIKMIRIVLLGPVLIALNLLVSNHQINKSRGSLYLPKFIIGFILFSILVSFNILPDNIILTIQKLSKILLTIAMVGIGLKISLFDINKLGAKALIVALIGFCIQISFVIIGVSLYF